MTLHSPLGTPDREGAGPGWAEEGVRAGSGYAGPHIHSQQAHQKAGGKAESRAAEEAQEKEGRPQKASPLPPTSR